MDTQALAAFTEIADSGSFTQAALALHLSQPAISKRITTLEQQIGQSLFDRIGRRVRLTDAGRALLPYARKALQDIEDGRRALSQLHDQIGGRLSIGTSHHIGLHRLPPVLRSFTQRYPEVDLDIHFMDSEIACEGVLAGKLELGIVTLPSQPIAQLAMQTIWPDPLSVVVAPNHPLLGKRRLRLHDLADHPAVFPDENTYTRRIVTQALQQHDLTPRIRLTTNYLETLKMLVGIGLGWSVLPDSVIDDSIRRLPVPALVMHRDLGCVWHQHRTASAAARALRAELNHLPTGLPD
ncbi:MAG TPA: LysR family transcriptional regulator [Solimonas sp.]